MDSITTGGTRMTILDFFPELLVEIFSYLSTCDLCKVAQTCKHFKDMAYSKRLWKNEEVVVLKYDYIDEDVAPSIAQRGIQKLDVHVSSLVQLDGVLHRFPVLESLSLDMLDMIWNHKWDDLKPLIIGFTSLKKFCLYSKDVEFFNDNTIEDLANILPELEDFCWRAPWNPEIIDEEINEDDEDEIKHVTNQGLDMMFSKLKKLRKFTLDCDGLTVVYTHDTTDFISECLEHLCLHRDCFSGESLQSLHHAFPNLLCLELYPIEQYTNKEWKSLDTLFTELKKIKKFVFEALEYSENVSFNCRSDSLEHLCLNKVEFTTCTLETIHRSFPNLRHLKLCWGNYTGSDLSGECLKFLSYLQELKISRCLNVPKTETDLISKQSSLGLRLLASGFRIKFLKWFLKFAV